MVPVVGTALPPRGFLIEDVESDWETVLRLDGDPVGCTAKRDCDAARSTLMRVDGEPCRFAGEPEPVRVDRRMAALVSDSGCTHVKCHVAVEVDRDPSGLASGAAQIQHQVRFRFGHRGDIRLAHQLNSDGAEVTRVDACRCVGWVSASSRQQRHCGERGQRPHVESIAAGYDACWDTQTSGSAAVSALICRDPGSRRHDGAQGLATAGPIPHCVVEPCQDRWSAS